MTEIINSLKETPITTILIFAGIFFILLAFVKNLGGFIEVEKSQQRWAALIGLFLLTVGIVLSFYTPSEEALNISSPNNDYGRLKKILVAKEYREADEQTRKIMYELSGLNGGYIDAQSMSKIPCEDIKRLDQLWIQHSDGKFGFSVQRNIWKKQPNSDDFGDRIGWRSGGKWLTVGELKYDASAPKGHLPTRSPGEPDNSLSGGWLVWELLPTGSDSRLSACLDSK